MPTALELAGLPIPEQVDQLSLIGTEKRDYIHGEHGEGVTAQRMIRRGNTKLIYYPVGNRAHLFDLEADPRETKDLATDPAHAEELASLVDLLLENLHGSDFEWVQDGKLTGLPDRDVGPISCKPLTGQRGLRFP